MFGLPLNILTYALGGVALISLLGAGVQTWRIDGYQTEVAQAKQQVAEYAGQAAKVNEIFAREEAMREHDRAEAEKKTAAETAALRNERDAIETKFKNVSADRAKLSAANRRFIANAPTGDSRPLGPTMVNYFSRLREQQQAARAGRVAATPGDCNEERLPGCPRRLAPVRPGP